MQENSLQILEELFRLHALGQDLDLVSFESFKTHGRRNLRLIEIQRESEGSGSDLRGLPVEELTVALHVLAELASCEPNLFKVMIGMFLVKAKNALEPLQEGNRSRIVQGELQSYQNFLFQVYQVFLWGLILLRLG